MHTKFVVKETAPGVWALSHVTPVCAAVGRTMYPSSEDAVQVARERDPDAVIEIQKLEY